jgi:hypothetical protein
MGPRGTQSGGQTAEVSQRTEEIMSDGRVKKSHFFVSTVSDQLTLNRIWYSVSFEVFTAVTMENEVFWDVTPCGSCKNRLFGGT